jgi:hypothetical protein
MSEISLLLQGLEVHCGEHSVPGIRFLVEGKVWNRGLATRLRLVRHPLGSVLAARKYVR